MLINLCDLLYKNVGFPHPESMWSEMNRNPTLNSLEFNIAASLAIGAFYGVAHYISQRSTALPNFPHFPFDEADEPEFVNQPESMRVS